MGFQNGNRNYSELGYPGKGRTPVWAQVGGTGHNRLPCL